MKKLDNKVNILDYKNSQKALTDEEINGLFLGLIKIVKKYAMEEAFRLYGKQSSYLSSNIKNLLEEMEQIRNENEFLKQENNKLKKMKDKNEILKRKHAELLTQKLAKYKVKKSI